MPLPIKGDAYAAAIGEVMDAFGPHAKHLVFVGSVVLVLYPPVPGVSLPLRPTKDVDCVSTLKPWILQQKIFEELIGRKVISPDMETAFRYRIRATGIMVDVLSPEGINLGGTTNRWIQEGARRAGGYRLPDGRSVRALTPPYLLATKLEALADRGKDLATSTDLEDIVTLAALIPDLVSQVEREGIENDLLALADSIKGTLKNPVFSGPIRNRADFGSDPRLLTSGRAVGLGRFESGPCLSTLFLPLQAAMGTRVPPLFRSSCR